MRSRTPCLTLLVALHLACGGDGDATTATDTGDTTMAQDDATTAPAETTAGECIPGYEGCACYEGECLGDLSCASNLCVALPSMTEESGPAETTDAVDGSTSDAPDDTSSGGGSNDTSSSESSTTEGVEACRDGETSCVDGTLQTCVDEMPVETLCEDYCGMLGFASDGCDGDDAGCLCGSALDETCLTGTDAFCFCSEQFGGACSNSDMSGYYQDCFADDPEIAPIMECFAMYVVNNQIDCNAAVNGCL